MVKRIKPVSRVIKIETEINKIVGEVFPSRRGILEISEGWVPYIDISEKRYEVKVEVEIPGVTQNDITILLYNNRVEIKGKKRENFKRGRIRYLRLEREYGSFHRIIFLPVAIIPDRAKATLENGILTIALKKYKQKKDKEVVLEIKKKRE